MAPEYTRGPWQLSRRNWRGQEDTHGNYYVSGDIHGPEEGGYEGYAIAVAMVLGNPTAGAIPLANARLIAQAPALVDALAEIATGLQYYLESYGDHGGRLVDLLNMARVAHAEATGWEPE